MLNEFVFKAGANVISAYTYRLFLSANQQRESTAGQPAVMGDRGPKPELQAGQRLRPPCSRQRSATALLPATVVHYGAHPHLPRRNGDAAH